MSGKRVILPRNYEQTNNNNETEETNNKRYLHQLDMGLEKLREVASEGHVIKIFLSHAWHEDALSADERNNPDLVRAAKYYDSLCWWLYEALTKAGFMVIFDKEQSQIRSMGAEGFMAKSVDESDVVLSVCTKLYHDRSEIASTGVGKEVNHISERIDKEGLKFFLPVLVSYDETIPPNELLPACLQGRNPIYVDGRNRDTYVTNLWCILAELYNAKAADLGKGRRAAEVKMAYVEALDHLRRIPDAFDISDGRAIENEESSRKRGGIYSDLFQKAQTELDGYKMMPTKELGVPSVEELIQNIEAGVRFELSLQQLTQYASSGDVNAGVYLARLYERGELMDKDMKASFVYWKKAADEGHVEAQFECGQRCRAGVGTEVDLNQAKRFYRFAANRGHPHASRALVGLHTSTVSEEDSTENVRKSDGSETPIPLSFPGMNDLVHILCEGGPQQKTPWEALFLTLRGKQIESDCDEEWMNVCTLLFHQTIAEDEDALLLHNWINTSTTEVISSHEPIEFSSEVKAACRLYGVHYFWFSWLYYVNDNIFFDYETLKLLSRVFMSFLLWIASSEAVPFQQIAEELRTKLGTLPIQTSVKAIISIKYVYEQQLQSILQIQKQEERSVLIYHLLSIAEIPPDINLQNPAYAPWKTWGQQYLEYFFAKKMLSVEKDANTDYYLRLATRLGCQPSLEQWDEFIDQMLLCRDEERCEEDERILLGFVRELKINMKSVMHHKDNKDRKIVEKIAEYIVKHQGRISAPRNERFDQLRVVCPEIEWHVLLFTFTPRTLPEIDKNTGQEYPMTALSGSRFLPVYLYNQLFDPGQHVFSPQESNHKGGVKVENGRHTVGFVQNHDKKNVLCFKMNPEFPMIEQAGLELMYGLFGYPDIPFSEVMRMNRKGSSLFLVSAYVEGIRADEVFSNVDHADMINKLDEQRVGELIIYSILSNPEDGRLQNYIFVRSDRDASLYKIVAIDIDHSFAAAIPQKLPGWFSKETKTSSMLFTLPLMSKPIAESIQERLRKLDVDELFVGWLDDLERLEHEYRKLYNENEEERAEYETTTTLTLPMNYARLMHVYWKLKELKSFVMDYDRTDETPQPTYMEALKRVEKYTGDRYEAVNESTLSVGERFKKSDGRLSSSMIRGDFRDYALRFDEKKKGSGSGSTALDTIAQVRESLRQKKQQHQKDIEEFEKMKEEFRRLSAAEQEELFVSYQSRITTAKEEIGTRTRGGRGRGKELDDAEIERKWLDLVSECVCEWQRLIIRHNGVLRKSWFVDAPKTAFYNLTLLELHDCSEVTGEVLDILSSQKSCRLEGVILSSLDNLCTVCARGMLGRQTNNPIELPDLKSIRFIKNDNLKRIHINSAKLRHLVIEDCSHIEWMSFGDINQLKSLQYDDITIQQNGDVRNLKALNIEIDRIFSAIKVASDSATLKNDTRNFQKLLDLFSWFSSITSAELLIIEHSRIALILSKNLIIAELIKELENYKILVDLYGRLLAINLPSSEILQSSYNNIITLFKNNNPNPQIIKKEIDNYLRIESLYEQFLKDEDNWGQQYGVSDLKNSFDYYRFINGKLVFKDPKKDNDINMREFSFRQFANKLEGEFDLSEIKGGWVSDYLSINIGYRKQRVSSHINKYGDGKTEVWIVPKFMVEKDLATSSSNHLEWYLDKWSSPVGIFFTRGDWDDFSSDSHYITNQQYNQINNQTLYNLYESSETRIISDKDIFRWWIEYFSFVF